MSRFSTAFQFLTVLPLFKARRFGNEELARSMAAFPLVGGFLGLILALAHEGFLNRLPPMMEGALLVAILALVTGGFHLDGVADTVDGLGGGYTPEDSLKIMKDSRIGALGAIALILVILLKVAGFGYLPEEIAFAALVATPAVARGPVVLLAYRARYARPAGGLGAPYTEHLDLMTLLAALIFSAAFSALLGWQGGLCFAGLVLWTGILRLYFNKRLGGVTGDALGFAEETGEALFLVILHLLY